MCVVSMVYDYGRRLPADSWTPEGWGHWKRLLEQAARADKAMKQPDCEDPAKAAWMREIEDRLRKLEAQQRAP